MRGSLSIAALYLAIAGAAAPAQEALKLNDENARLNYSIAYKTGNDFKSQGMVLDQALVIKGIEDGFSGAESPLTRIELREALAGLHDELRRKVLADRQSQVQMEAEEWRKAGGMFLGANKANEGVKVTESGLQYKVIRPGSGSSPSRKDKVKVHYRGTRVDGMEFESTYAKSEPTELELKRQIAGLREGLQLMSEGAKYELYIPPELAYEDQGPLAHQTLIFEIELLSVVKPAE